jgi:hypothetical protein
LPVPERRQATDDRATLDVVFRTTALLLAALCAASATSAQSPAQSPARAAPVAEAQATPVRATVRAVRTTAPIRIDGQLDEAIYGTVPPFDTFYQSDPKPGAPASQRTELWILFDDQYVYATFRCWQDDPEHFIANELRRDNLAIVNNDYVAVSFDTMLDRLNGNFFTVTPIGGRMDGQSSNDRALSNDPNPIWLFKTGRFEGGWTAEMAIPFKSLRVQASRQQT